MILVSLLLPVVAIMVLRRYINKPDTSSPFRHETIIGLIAGCTGITLLQTQSIIEYYFLGDRGKLLLAFGLTVPELDLEALIRASFADLVVWSFMVILSAAISYMASVLLTEK